ncbi:hypothetical protein JST99_01160 [Candidatus Dependentiae bacterium]|nr:hypothetical protein [Candidatus Dependentiae bacterium]MCC7415026.1 hypothetical protein [Campylobacterota bacterium]
MNFLRGFVNSPVLALTPLSTWNFTIVHYTMRFLRGERGGYKKSYEASFLSSSIYFALFLPLFSVFAAFNRGEPYINVFVAKILFYLLVTFLLCIFIFQHMEAVITWTGENSLKQSAKRACYLICRNKVIVITLTCLLFLTCIPLLIALQQVELSIDLGDTPLQAFKAIASYLGKLFFPYYVITLSINLYCMSLTIFYYEYYVRKNLSS